MMFQAQNGEYCEEDHSMHAKGTLKKIIPFMQRD